MKLVVWMWVNVKIQSIEDKICSTPHQQQKHRTKAIWSSSVFETYKLHILEDVRFLWILKILLVILQLLCRVHSCGNRKSVYSGRKALAIHGCVLMQAESWWSPSRNSGLNEKLDLMRSNFSSHFGMKLHLLRPPMISSASTQIKFNPLQKSHKPLLCFF